MWNKKKLTRERRRQTGVIFLVGVEAHLRQMLMPWAAARVGRDTGIISTRDTRMYRRRTRKPIKVGRRQTGVIFSVSVKAPLRQMPMPWAAAKSERDIEGTTRRYTRRRRKHTKKQGGVDEW